MHAHDMSNRNDPLFFNVSFITNGGGVMMSVTWRICLYSTIVANPLFCPFSELSTLKKGEVDNGEGGAGWWKRCKSLYHFYYLLPWRYYSSRWPTCEKDMIIVQYTQQQLQNQLHPIWKTDVVTWNRLLLFSFCVCNHHCPRVSASKGRWWEGYAAESRVGEGNAQWGQWLHRFC